jgi:pyruvate,orthophosphate dikinase
MEGTGVVSITEAAGLDRSVIGGKAASLAQLAGLGLPVPPAFVITTQVCREHLGTGRLPARTVDAIDEAVAGIEQATGRRFGGTAHPLLLSVRSGAGDSMPGMMDTILDVGFGPATRDALAATGDEAFADGCHARFLAGYASVVLGLELPRTDDPDGLSATLGARVPSDPRRQLFDAVGAVCRSWGNERAYAYREHHGIGHELGTAVVVQAMVFGNLDWTSGSGVASSRDPNTGRRGLCGDFLPRAQGEDVVAGNRHPMPLAGLAEVSTSAFTELEQSVAVVEFATRDMVDVEFTVEAGTLHLLQHRPGTRAAAAAVGIAVDLVDEGVITIPEALARVSPAQLARAGSPTVADDAGALLATGLGACPGAVTGEVCLSADHVGEHTGPVVLVRPETSPHDVHGMTMSAGLLTASGGLVSHAALLARELDLPAVVGVGELDIDDQAGSLTIGGAVLVEGDLITVDGATGRVHAGDVPVIDSAPGEHLERFRAWLAGSGATGGSGPAPI